METNDNYKIVFLDVDGTLLRPDQTISEHTIETLTKLQENNIECVIASGRQREMTKNLSKRINGSKFVISATGSDVYDYENNIEIFKDVLDRKIVEKLYNLVEFYNARIRLLTGSHAYSNKPSKNAVDIEKPIGSDINEFLDRETVSQCVIMTKDIEVINKIKQEIKEIPSIKICNQSKILADENYKISEYPELFIDVCNARTSKGNGIKKLCEYLNIKKEDTVSIGDDFNDLPMFENTNISVAMGNSPQKVKEEAKLVTLNNSEDGVAYIIEKIFKKILV